MEMIIDDLALVGHPVSLIDDRRGDEQESRGRQVPRQSQAESQESAAKQKNSSPSNKLNQFHFVLVLDRPDPSANNPLTDLNSYIQFFYDNVVFKMTAALYAEEKRTGYVAEEAQKLIDLRERCIDDGQSLSAYNTQCLGISSLARSIRDIYTSLCYSSDAFVTINDHVEVHLQLPPILRSGADLLNISDVHTDIDPIDPVFLSGGGFAGLGKDADFLSKCMSLEPEDLIYEEWTRTTGPYLLPWKTLLLAEDSVPPQNFMAEEGDESQSAFVHERTASAHDGVGVEPWAKKFTSLLQPTLAGIPTFAEIADLLEWDLYEDVYPMVRHLLYYRKARSSTCLASATHIPSLLSTTLQISPNAPRAGPKTSPRCHLWSPSSPSSPRRCSHSTSTRCWQTLPSASRWRCRSSSDCFDPTSSSRCMSGCV